MVELVPVVFPLESVVNGVEALVNEVLVSAQWLGGHAGVESTLRASVRVAASFHSCLAYTFRSRQREFTVRKKLRTFLRTVPVVYGGGRPGLEVRSPLAPCGLLA